MSEDELAKRRERLEAWRRQREKFPGASPPIPQPKKISIAMTAAVKKKTTVAPFHPKNGAGKEKQGNSRDEDDDDDEEGTRRLPLRKLPRMEENEEEVPPVSPSFIAASMMEIDSDNAPNGGTLAAAAREEEGEEEEFPLARKERDGDDDADDLDAYMANVNRQVEELHRSQDEDGTVKVAVIQKKGTLEDDAGPKEDAIETEEDIFALAAKRAKKKELPNVDHSAIDYEPFRKNFYIESSEISQLSPEELEEVTAGIKISGLDCPRPIQKWSQSGLLNRILDVIKKMAYEKPTPIQAQAIPAVMSGRDVIGVAKTGSGKTIAFLLPMLRHIKAQRPLAEGEGPIGLILTPTRELALQTFVECKRFGKPLDLRAVCAYGGAAIKDQIAEFKRGAEIVVCTPGRMIDLLTSNQGRVTNLRRVTYLVLDEADRMFDMGFEPQVMKIINNARPDKQIVLFSATFPRQMEALAKRILKEPLEIQVGGRSVVCSDVTQHVEVVDPEKKFFKLLEVLGNHYDPEKRILIFVDRQDAADNLFKQLLGKGYVCLSLHGGKDQYDRDQTLSDFKNGACPILVATSVAARGLDVKLLHVVINYDCPNHLEDYVHRCGRTGRAGNKGDAYTFVTPEEDRFAGDIVRALEQSGTEVPPSLGALWEGFQEKVKSGKEKYHSSGFSGKGLDQLEKDRDVAKRAQQLTYGGGEDAAHSDPEDEVEVDEETGELLTKTKRGARRETSSPSTEAAPAAPLSQAAKEARSRAAAIRIGGDSGNGSVSVLDRVNQKLGAAISSRRDYNSPFTHELDINDYPQHARWRVISRETLRTVGEFSGAALTPRGNFLAPGKQHKPDDKRLHIFIEADSAQAVENAIAELKRILMEATVEHLERGGTLGVPPGGKYSVV